MSRISAPGMQGVSYSAGRRPDAESLATATSPPSSGPASTADVFRDGFSRSELLAMNAGIDEASRASNALSTAGDAIGVIGGLLGNIQTVLHAAGSSGDRTFDSTTEQSRIDSAVTTIDAIATSSRFAGQPLLDGSFSVAVSTVATAIPSFVSSTLGTSNNNGASTASLSSLVSGGANDLESGKLETAGEIVTTAMSQVGQMQAQISHFLAASRESSSEPRVDADAAASTASEIFADPFTASSAAANSSAQRVLALLG